MNANDALAELYNVCEDNYLPWLDELMVKAGFRTEGVFGEMREVDSNSIETLRELRDNYVPYDERTA